MTKSINFGVQVEILKHIDLNNGRMECRLESFEKKTKAAMFNFNQVATHNFFSLIRIISMFINTVFTMFTMFRT